MPIKDNVTNCAYILAKHLNYPVSLSLLRDELLLHPDYPSLLAISDVFAALDIENAAFRIDNDDVTTIPCPFIAHTNLTNQEFMVVDKIEGDNVFVSNEKWKEHKLKVESFKSLFMGVVLAAEPSSEKFLSANNLKVFLASLKSQVLITSASLLLILAIVFHSVYFENLNWQNLLLTLFKSAGLITSILLLIQSIDNNNPLIQVLCGGGGKTDCNAILSSKAAKVFEGLSWSEVGFFYFSGTWLLLLFGGGSTVVWQVLALLNFVSLPYTVYSIYYQARVAKQWCVLCCTVQALLWLEFFCLILLKENGAISFLTFLSFDNNRGSALSAIFICLLSPVILWMILRPLFLQLQQLHPLKQQLQKFKYNAELFNNLLTSQPKHVVPDESWSLVLGNVEASHTITMVSNPYCSPCGKSHRLLNELLGQNGNIQARIIFTANNTTDDIKTPVSRHLMALNELSDKTIVKKALHDWYEQKQKDYNAWSKNYPIELKETEYYKLDKQHAWHQMAEVTATPAFFVNGYRLPDSYQLPDLKYMLE